MNVLEKILVVPDQEINYNLCKGGRGGFGYINQNRMNFDLNSLPREKLSAARKLGGKNSYIYKSFRKKRKGNRAFLGKKHSLTSKHKISLANTGKPAWNKGIPRSQETKDKIRNSLLNRFSLTNPSV